MGLEIARYQCDEAGGPQFRNFKTQTGDEIQMAARATKVAFLPEVPVGKESIGIQTTLSWGVLHQFQLSDPLDSWFN